MFCGYYNSRDISAEQSVFGWIQASAIHDTTINRELQVYNEVRLDSNSIFIVTSKHYKVWKPNISTTSKMVFVQTCHRYLNVRIQHISNGSRLSLLWGVISIFKTIWGNKKKCKHLMVLWKPVLRKYIECHRKVHSNWCVCYGRCDANSHSTRYLPISAVKS